MRMREEPSRASGDDDIDMEVGFDGTGDFDDADEGSAFEIEDDEPSDGYTPLLEPNPPPVLATGTHPTIEVPEDSHRSVRVLAFFQSLDKLLRGIRLYEGRGDLVERLAARTRARADAMVADGEVLVRVAPFGVVYDGKPINPADDKPAKYLFRLFCDGVRELTFLRPLDGEELRAFAEVLASDARSADEDLITLLWKRELKTIRYYATDTLQTGDGGMDEDDLALASAARTRLDTAQENGEELVMSAEDLRMLDGDDALLWVRRSRSPSRPSGALAGTATAVKTAFNRADDYGRFVDMALRLGSASSAASPLVVGLFDGLLAAGDAAATADLLAAAAKGAQATAGGRLLRDTLIATKRLPRLAGLLDGNPDALTDAIHAAASGRRETLVEILNLLTTPDVRDGLRERLLSEGVDLTTYYSERMRSADPEVLVDAIEALGTIGGPEAAKAIIPALGATVTSVRRAGLEAMQGGYHSDARVALGRALRDPDQDNRLLALAVLRDSNDSRAVGPILSTVQASSFQARSAAEKEAFFEALAAFKDKRTLDFFDSVLSQKNLTRSKVVAAQQMTAVVALKSMGTAAAAEALDKAAKRWFLPAPVREAASRGLA